MTATAGGASIAHGELTRSGNLIVSLQGTIEPRSLPRDRLAPVKVHIKGSVKTVDGSQPPVLRQLAVAINSHGKIFSRGLPICTTRQLQQRNTEAALAACRGALVGHGTFDASVAFPNLVPFPAHGAVLVFNGRHAGHQAIIFHIFGSNPVQITFVLPLTVERRHGGKYGTTLSAKFPRIASDLGYVTGVDFTMGRRYLYKGKMRSFLSASCAAPEGFTVATFPFVKGTFGFSSGQSIDTSLIRNCQVRG
ncbi:MAG TPA: hypothetical protein VF176_02260 [Solirubrobacterales bacterium]